MFLLERCAMPIESSHTPLDLPNVDLWRFLFERQDREYPDNKGFQPAHPFPARVSAELTKTQSSMSTPTPADPIPTLM